jgi:hypothetical protein
MGQFADCALGALELGVEPFFKLRHRHMRRMAIVKLGEGQGKLGAKFFDRHFGFAGLRQNKIGRLEHGRQIVHERAGPIENDIADHTISLSLRTAVDTMICGPQSRR